MFPEGFTAISNHFVQQIHLDAWQFHVRRFKIHNDFKLTCTLLLEVHQRTYIIISTLEKAISKATSIHRVPTRPELVKIPERLPSSPALYQLIVVSFNPSFNQNDILELTILKCSVCLQMSKIQPFLGRNGWRKSSNWLLNYLLSWFRETRRTCSTLCTALVLNKVQLSAQEHKSQCVPHQKVRAPQTSCIVGNQILGDTTWSIRLSIGLSVTIVNQVN